MTFGTVLAVVGAGALVAGFGYAQFRERARHSQRRKRFDSRRSMSIDELYDTYFASPEVDRAMFEKVWSLVGKTVRIDPGLLRPTDRLKEELGPAPGFELSDEIEELGEELDELAQKRGVEIDADSVKSLGDVVLLLCGR
jgi:hypothetical protein